MSSIQPTQVQHNQPVEYNFKDLNKGHKALVVIVSIFLSIFTLGIGAWLLVPHLIGRLRKLEEGSKAAETAKKIEENFNPNKGMSSQALIDTFWCDIDIIDQIIEEKADPTVDSEHRYDNVKSESVRDVYKRIKRDNGQELDLNIMQDTIIDDQIIIVLKQRKDPVKFPAKISGKNEELLTYKTLGDGACGDHALVGEVKNGYYRAANPLETRKKLCEHLQKCFDENNVPLGIQLLLEDSFRKPDMMGAQFREALKITENGKEIDLLDKFKKANKTAEDFASDKQVFKAYLASLSNPNTYLAIEELGILATCLNKSLRLFKQSDTDPKEVTELEDGPVFSRTPGEEVVVYFNAKGQHFERAVIRAKNS